VAADGTLGNYRLLIGLYGFAQRDYCEPAVTVDYQWPRSTVLVFGLQLIADVNRVQSTLPRAR